MLWVKMNISKSNSKNQSRWDENFAGLATEEKIRFRFPGISLILG